MAIQQRNDELVNLASADLQKRYESSFAWKTACSMIQALTGLRGFWPMSAFASGGNCYDQSGNARTLTYNGNPYYGHGAANYGLAPYIRFDGTGDYLSRTDEAGLSITGTETYVKAGQRGLTLGGWFYPENVTNQMSLISKWAPGANFSYLLQIDGSAGNDPTLFYISDDGTNTSSVSTPATLPFVADTWQFFAGRFNDADTGAELAVWLNDTITTAATARNSIADTAADFNISGHNSGTSLLTGRASLCFLCAAALDNATVWAIYQHTRALFGV